MSKATKKPEVTTSHMASLAAKTLVNPDATPLEKKLAGALLTQAPDRPKGKIKK
ncbi:MAG: hypothetical protein JWP81_1350 [Ferruginibacter sp.]|nr:hypothetical protein [Ferruginibacter sp.]